MAVFFLYLLQYTGAFKKVEIGTDERGAYTLIYKNHVGPYHQIVSKILEVETWAKENKLNCRYSFGEYFDNPAIVEEGRLNSRGGCLLEPDSETELQIFEALKNNLPKDFLYSEFPKTKAVVALFSGAASIGPYKVYPKAEDYMKENNLVPVGNTLEIYEVLDKNSMQNTYIWPIK